MDHPQVATRLGSSWISAVPRAELIVTGNAASTADDVRVVSLWSVLSLSPLLLQAAIPAARPHAARTATIRRTRLAPLRRSDSPRPKILATPGPPGRSTCSDTPSG